MKVKIELEKHEHLHEAEELLTKAVAAKSNFEDSERYSDAFLNEFHDHVIDKHKLMLKNLIEEIQEEVIRDARFKPNT